LTRRRFDNRQIRAILVDIERLILINGWWISALVSEVGNYISFETTDGLIREGKLTGLRSQSLIWNCENVEIITEIEMNGDPYDTVPINRIKKIELV